MAADSLDLLFRLKSDSSQAVGDVRRLRAAFAKELEGMRRLAADAVRVTFGGGQKGGRGSASAVDAGDANRVKEYNERLSQLRQTLNSLQQSVKSARQELAGSGQETATTTRRFEVLEDTISKLTARADELQASLAATGATAQAARQLDSLSAAAERTNSTFLNTQARLADAASGADAVSLIVGEIRELGEVIKGLEPGNVSKLVSALGSLGHAAQGASALKEMGFTLGHVQRAAAGARGALQGAATGAQGFLSAVGQRATAAVSSLGSNVSGLASRLPGLASGFGAGAGGAVALGAAAAAAAVAVVAIGAAVVGLVAAFAAAVVVIPQVVDLLQTIFDRGIAYNSQLEQIELGIGAVVASLATLRDATGQQLEGPEKLNASLTLASEQMQKLKVDAVNTTATLEQIAPAFQGAIGAGIRAGLTLDQIRETVVRITQAAGALGIPMHQINQEVRAILEGTINEDARLAKVLGISNEMVKSWKEQGKLAEELNKRLEGFGVAGEKAANTLDGLKSNLQEALNVFTGAATERAFETLKGRIQKILPQLFDFKSAGIDRSLQALAELFDDIFVRVINIAGDVVEDIISGVKRVGQFVAENRQLIDAILDAAEGIVRIIIEYAKHIAGAASSTGVWREVLHVVHGLLVTIQVVLLSLAPAINGAAAAMQGLVGLLLLADPTLRLISALAGSGAASGQAGAKGSLGGITVTGPPPGAGKAKKGKGGGGGGKDKDAARRLKEISLDEAEFEADFKRASEAAERDFDRRLSSLEEFTEDEVDLLGRWLADKRAIYDREEREAIRSTKNAADLEIKLREISQKRTAAEDEAARKRNELEDRLEKDREALHVARLERRAAIDDAAADGRIARIEAQAEEEIITEREAAQQIGKIRLEIHDRAVRLLNARLALEREGSVEYINIQKAIGVAEQERANITEETERRVRAGREADLENAKRHRDALISIQQATAEALVAARRITFDLFNRRIQLRRDLNVKERRQVVEHEANLSHVELAFRQARVLGAIQDEIKKLERKKELNKQEVEQLKALHEQLKAETERFNKEAEEIEQRRAEGLKEAGTGGFFGALIDEWERLKRAMADTSPLEALGKAVAGTFKTIVESTRAGIQAWLIYGQSVRVAIRKALAEQLAGVAAEAGIMALLHAAHAIGSAAFGHWSKAAKHALAAAKFGALALVAGAGAKLAAGNLFSGGGAGGGDVAGGMFAGDNQRESERTRREREAAEQDRFTRREDRGGEIRVVLEVNSRNEPGALTEAIVKTIEEHSGAHAAVNNAWVTNFERDGRTRQVVVKEIRGTPVD